MRRRLDSWKEIAAHLERRVRTVQRWEKEEGLPVHRQAHRRRGNVFAWADELDAWRLGRTLPPGEAAAIAASAAPPEARFATRRTAVAAAAVLCVVLAGWIAAARLSRPAAPPAPAEPDGVLQARYLLHRGSPEEVRRAVALCARLDAGGPAAQAARHECLAHGALALTRLGELPLQEGLRRAVAAAERALALDPHRAEAQALATWSRYARDWDVPRAEAGYRRAVALDPAAALPHHRLANLLSAAGRHREAIAELRLAQRAAPLSAAINDDGCWFFYRARRWAEAVREAERALTLEPERTGALECIADASAARGDHARARAAAVAMLRALGDEPAAREIAAAPAAEARTRLERRLLAQLAERDRTQPVPASPYAMRTAALGRRDEALGWLERALAAREPVLLLVRVHPAFDSLRGDPRLEALLQRAGV